MNFKIKKREKKKSAISKICNNVSISKTALVAKKILNFQNSELFRSKKISCEGKSNILLKLNIGEFSDMTTDYINSKAIEVLKENKILYTSVGGLSELKEEICNDILHRKGCSYKKENVVCSNGAKQSVYQIIKLLCNHKDEVIIISPFWTSYPEMVKLVGAKPVIIETTYKTRYFPTIEQFKKKITKRTKLIIICNPNNPTGMVIDKGIMNKFVDFIKDYKNIYILSDEIYERIDFDNKHRCLGIYDEIIDNLFVVNGFSKVFCMTGYRLGYTLCPEKFANKLCQMQSHITGSPNAIAQYTCIKLLKDRNNTNSYINKMVGILKQNRDYVYEKLINNDNIIFLKPEGGYYIFINMIKIIGKKYNNEIIKNVDKICDILLYDYLIGVTGGNAFGMEKYIRVSLSGKFDNIKIFVERFNKFLKKIIL